MAKLPVAMEYRNTWRKGRFEFIDNCKEEEKRYNAEHKGFEWEQEFGNLSEEEITRKKNLWFSINWVESNTVWRDVPDFIRTFEAKWEYEMHYQSTDMENPDSVCYRNVRWYQSTRSGDDPNNRGFGVDVKYNYKASHGMASLWLKELK